MANPLVAGSWQLSVGAKISGAQIDPQGNADVDGIDGPTWNSGDTAEQNLTFGTDTDESDIYCMAGFEILAGADLTIDLFASGLKNLFGGEADFRHLTAIYVNIVTGTGDSAGVTIGDAAANPNVLWFGAVDQTWTIKPNGPPMIGGESPGVVVDATNRNVLIHNNGAVAVTVVVGLAGTST